MSALIAKGIITLGTIAIAPNTCTTPITAPAPGARWSDWIRQVNEIQLQSNLFILAYPKTEKVSVVVCNSGNLPITPIPATLKWEVYREVKR